MTLSPENPGTNIHVNGTLSSSRASEIYRFSRRRRVTFDAQRLFRCTRRFHVLPQLNVNKRFTSKRRNEPTKNAFVHYSFVDQEFGLKNCQIRPTTFFLVC